MKVLSTLCLLLAAVISLGMVGCGKSNPNANVPPEKVAPAPEELGSDPEYAKQFGGKK
ncbi:MAG: hypothetical protein KF777_08420 [Planctomycetaceae bacterium]|nr:hypothetical protein [Planctomycetaceae bacterium]